MNCKPGDLAVIVNPQHVELRHFVGRLLVVKKLVGVDFYGDPVWSYKGARLKADGLICTAVSDKWLRPIRDQPGEDEMIRIAGLPQNLKETA